MSFGSFVVRVVVFLNQNDVSLEITDTTYLLPEQRNRTSNLNIGGDLWLDVELIAFNETDLLNFDEVSNVTMHIDSSFLISSTGISSRSSCNEDKGTVLCITFEIYFRYVPMNHRHSPSFLDQDLIKIFDQIMIPQKL